MQTTRNLVFLILSALVVLQFCSSADAGDTLSRIKTKGILRCGVSDGILGFSSKDLNGRWSGMDVDFCRALLPPCWGTGKATFVSLATSARFSSLKAGEINILVRNTTWTLEREATLELMFAGHVLRRPKLPGLGQGQCA